MSTTAALTKVGTSAFGKLNPHITRWFLKKYFPIDTRKLIIEFNRFPNINLNFSVQEHSMWFEFELNNFGLYNLELVNFHCTVSAGGYNLITLKESVAYELKVDGTYKFSTNHQLTTGDASRIKQHVPNQSVALAEMAFYFTVRSRFGLEELVLPPKKACIQIREYPPPQNIT